ncbi:MAG: hypothetical protein Q9162_003308 [Coniocarpon cinnabarinum]
MAESSADASAPTEAVAPPYQPKKVTYCGVCSLPPEYCEFSPTPTKCEQWLKQTHPDLHSKYYSEETLANQMSNLSTSQQAAATKSAAKAASKAAAAEEREATKRATSKVYIKRVERNKRKYVTVITGLENHGQELKKVAKDFGKKFATGSSVTKRPDGTGDEITVQGDVADDVEEYILDNMEEIPGDNVEITEDKKKKGAG